MSLYIYSVLKICTHIFEKARFGGFCAYTCILSGINRRSSFPNLHASFLPVKHGKFPTRWQQVSRRVIQLARLKFQLRTYRISATPVAKRFGFASEQQYFPRSVPRFGLISGIIIPCPSSARARPSFVVSSLFLNIIVAFPAPAFSGSSRRDSPCFFFFPVIEINRGRWTGRRGALPRATIFYFCLARRSSIEIKFTRE